MQHKTIEIWTLEKTEFQPPLQSLQGAIFHTSWIIRSGFSFIYLSMVNSTKDGWLYLFNIFFIFSFLAGEMLSSFFLNSFFCWDMWKNYNSCLFWWSKELSLRVIKHRSMQLFLLLSSCYSCLSSQNLSFKDIYQVNFLKIRMSFEDFGKYENGF